MAMLVTYYVSASSQTILKRFLLDWETKHSRLT